MTAAAPADLRALLGDRYAIERELGRGGMGTVYLARDLRLDRQVALKVLPPEFAADPALRDRFLRETRTAASFSHPNIVPVHAVEERDGVLAFAMGYVEGESLAERVHRLGPLDVRGIVRVLQDIGYALAYAHGRGVVHRDIKPDNIMLERATGRAQLMDFGISRTITTTVETRGLTRVGEVVGTPEYMSPEQASGDVVDGRSDLYSLGLVALFALTGKTAVTAETTQKILVKQLTETLPPATSLRGDLPAALGDAIDRCVAKQPDHRFATAEALVEAIDDARLAAPEIPLPIRLFAQEAATLGLVIMFLTLMAPLIFSTMSHAEAGSIDALVPVIFLLAIALTRVLQTSSAARRLANAGFPPDDVLKGLNGVLEEREAMRQFLRTDADTVARRRKTLTMVKFMVPVSIVLFTIVRMRRYEYLPGRYAVGSSGLVLVVTAVMLAGMSLVLMLRSPFRAPVGERLFRAVWLGPFGRAFLRVSARNANRPVGSVSQPSTGAVSQPAMAVAPARASRTIEERVEALERWRDSAGCGR